MGSITLTKTRECAHGTHWNVAVSGDATGEIRILLSDLTDQITEEDKVAFFKVLMRIAKIKRTNAQLRNALNSGLTVTI